MKCRILKGQNEALNAEKTKNTYYLDQHNNRLIDVEILMWCDKHGGLSFVRSRHQLAIFINCYHAATCLLCRLGDYSVCHVGWAVSGSKKSKCCLLRLSLLSLFVALRFFVDIWTARNSYNWGNWQSIVELKLENQNALRT